MAFFRRRRYRFGRSSKKQYLWRRYKRARTRKAKMYWLRRIRMLRRRYVSKTPHFADEFLNYVHSAANPPPALLS